MFDRRIAMENSVHKLLAVLSADAVGYSRLMADNDAETVATLDACRRIFREQIKTAHGRVVDMAGDSVLAVFDSATHAVQCAVAIQDLLAGLTHEVPKERKMRFRIGINLGEVIEKTDGTVYGDGVNIASRLEGLAEPGGINISGNISEQIEGKLPLSLKFAGEHKVKNIPKPVTVYHVHPVEASTEAGTATKSAQLHQDVRFCTSSDGATIAYSIIGKGPPLVKSANWLNHLEFDLESPIWRHLLQEFARDHELIRYDARGNGLSDWDAEEISFDAFVDDMETVVDAAGVDRFPILGVSQGCAVAIAYAIRNPDRVTGLVLYGGFARGRRKRGSKEQMERADAYVTLIRQGWGQENPAFRQMFTSMFVPDATKEQMSWFNDLQKSTASAENAVRMRGAVDNIDVSGDLNQLKVPTLVLHCRNDGMAPYEEGRRMAAMIPGARFVTLEGQNHLILEHEPAWARFKEEVRSFLDNELAE